MRTFEIKDEFYVDGQPTKLISGAIHYFRLPPDQWQDSLYNLKALGANTVETYLPWNLHEPQKGYYDFEGNKDVGAFIELAGQLGLMVILRPSVYICAEWEFGGLPAWLLPEPIGRIRSTDACFMARVNDYYSELLPRLVGYQVTHGGPVIMMQVENEYGSYGMEKVYLKETRKLMLAYGVDVPLFTSDGTWIEALEAGSLIDEDVFVAGNFGSRSRENSQILQDFLVAHHKKWPLMCMEFWDGWFNRWDEAIIRRDPEELAAEVKTMLELGSINLYMFHGGTNFGFYNGCSARGSNDLPQVTSYDYDGLLTEWGEPTEKYYAVQRVIKDVCPDVWQGEPRRKTCHNLGRFPVTDCVTLGNTIEAMVEGQDTGYPLNMEEAGSGYGYMFYRMALKNYHHETKLKVIESSDRIQVFADNRPVGTQYREEIGEELFFSGTEEAEFINVDILVENLGRVNYGYKLNGPTQSKGIRGGVFYRSAFQYGYRQFALDFSPQQLKRIDFSGKANDCLPSFYKFQPDLNSLGDTFIDCSNYGKGSIFVNGNNLGRYWQRGPIHYLYCPKGFLKEGVNEVIIFETEGCVIRELIFCDHPVYK